MKLTGLALGALAVVGLVVLSRGTGTVVASPSAPSNLSSPAPTTVQALPEQETHVAVSSAPSFPIYNPETYAQTKDLPLADLIFLKNELWGEKIRLENNVFDPIRLSGYDVNTSIPGVALRYEQIRGTLRDLAKQIKYYGM